MELVPLEMSPREAIMHLCREWGVPLIISNEADGVFRAITHPAPANAGGICWPKKSIIWSQYQLRSHTDLCGLIHDLAHILIDVAPSEAHEISSPMLALEETHRYLVGVSQKGSDAWMANFQTDVGAWRYTTWVLRNKIMTDSLRAACEKGLLDDKGAPTFKRYKRRG